MSIFIFDLDGTVALIDHRRHLVAGNDKDWQAFFAACVDDFPNVPVIETLNCLFESGHDIWIWSGRSDIVRAETEEWLKERGVMYDELRMRPDGDHQPDEHLKRGWLFGLEAGDRASIAAIFDDRDSVVAMWRNFKIPTFQVAPGAF
jgi:hypothetical protein